MNRRRIPRAITSIAASLLLAIAAPLVATTPANAAAATTTSATAALAAPAASAPVPDLDARVTRVWQVAEPRALVAGPDGNVWFTDRNAGIGRLSPDGSIRTFTDGAPLAGGPGITVGADGALWATDDVHHTIVRVGTDGAISRVTDPTIQTPAGITAGPDGALWFTDPGAHTIGRVTTGGALTTFTDANLADPWAITAGPDGALWFTQPGHCTGCTTGIGRLATDGTLTWTTDGRFKTPTAITVGPDGNLWITDIGSCTLASLLDLAAAAPCGGTVAQVTTAGVVTVFSSPDLGAPTAIAAEPGGTLLVTNTLGSNLVRLATDGTTTVVDTDAVRTACLAVDAAGSAWYPRSETHGPYPLVLTRLMTDGSTTSFPDTRRLPQAMLAAAPDASLWGYWTSTDPAAPDQYLTRITPDGDVASFPTPPGLQPLADLVAGPGGRMWFTWQEDATHGGIGSVDDTGAFDLVDDPRLAGWGLASGPDGALWIARPGSGSLPGAIVRYEVGGTVTTFAGDGIGLPTDPAAASDGRLAFLDNGTEGHRIVRRLEVDGTTSTQAAVPGADIMRFALAGDGSIWADARTWPTSWWLPAIDELVHFSPNGTLLSREFALASGGGTWIDSLETGPDGRLWYQVHWSDNGTQTSGTALLSRAIAGDGSTIQSTPSWDNTQQGFVFDRTGRLWLPESHGTDYLPGQRVVGLSSGVAAPKPPTGVAAVPGASDGSVAVSWTAPATDDGLPVTGYRVTASPGGGFCTATAPTTTCTVADLTPGVGYTFVVAAITSAGWWATADPVGPVTPERAPGSGFTPVTPFRVGDTRVGSNVGFAPGAIHAGRAKALTVAGVGGVPVSARAVVATVTVTNPTAASYLTAYPTGAAVPGTANLLFAPGQTVAQTVTIPIGPDGDVSFFNQLGDVDVVVDLIGYYDDGTTPAGRLNAVDPVRVLDSRTTDTTTGPGPGQWNGQPLGPDQTRTLSLTGTVPATATAAVVNLTVTAGSDPSYLQALPGGATRAQTATTLFAPGQTITTLTTVGLGPDQTIDLYNQQGNVHVVADLVGWYDPTTGDLFHPITPRRLHDTRTTTPSWLTSGTIRTLDATHDDTDNPALPADATALAGTLTATGGTDPSYLTAGPTPLPNPPGTASLLFAAGQTIPNAITTGLFPTHTLDLYNQTGTVHAILDLTGYWSST